MIQEIAPKHLDNQFRRQPIEDTSKVCVFRDGDILLSIRNGEVFLPEYRLLKHSIRSYVYLFSVDNEAYFLADVGDGELPEGFMFDNVRTHRKSQPKHTVYAMMTARHLYIWYRDNQFCGRCGKKTVHDDKLRMMRFKDC